MAAMKHKLRKRFSKGILCFLCFLVTLSFFAILVPISSASSDKSNAMACCVGKAAGHCDSGIPAEKIPPPPREPMCGLDNSEFEDDEITIVAEPSHKESHDSLSQTAETTSHAAESTSVSKPCQMVCGTCSSASSRQQKREKGIAQVRERHTSPSSSISRLEDLPLVITSDENWPRTIPRGPPASSIN